MENIVVADKQSAVATQNAWGNISLNGPGVVQMPVPPDQVANVTQRGQDLIVTLKSGEKVTIGNFFAVNQAGVGSDMVFVGEDGTLWHADYDAAAFTGFTFNEVASLDELVAGIGTAGEAMPTWAIAGLSLLGVGGGAAAVSGGGGGGGSGGGTPAPDTTAPATPIDLLVSPDGLRLSGRGEAGATVNVRDAAGNVIGNGTVGADGSFEVALNPPQVNNENLQVTLTDGAGNESAPGTVTAPDATAPLPPGDLAIDAQGVTLTGRGEPGTTVNVRDAAGNVIGSGSVAADGSFSVVLSPAQINSESLQVTLTDATGNVSQASSITAPDLTPPLAPTDLAVSAQGTTLTGRAEPGSTVAVRGAGGVLLGTATAGADGLFSITLQPAQTDGQGLTVTATDAAGNLSPGTNITAPDIDGVDTTPPGAPVDLAVGLAGTRLTGRGEAGTTVQVRDAAGNVIATGTVGPNGTFAVSLNPAVKDGSTLQVTLTDAAGNVSQPGSVASPDLTAPAQPTDLALADGVTFTGRGEPGATVQVRDAAGTVLGTGIVGSDGLFNITLSPAQANGQALDVQLIDAAGNVSAPLQFDAPDITPPDAVTNILIGPGGTALSGRGEAGATVEVRDADGNLLGRGVVTANGTFLVSLDPAAQPGEQLSLVQIDPSGNASVAVDYEVPLTTAPESPTNLTVNADGTALTGTAPAGSRVEVRDTDGTLIGSGTANADGTFSIPLNPAQANGELLDVVAIENGLSSLPAQVIAPDITAPAAPTELAVSADGTVITGRAEPGSTVRILGANGTELGTAVVGATGLFSISLTPPQVDGEVLQATATDAAGNTSTASTVTAPDIDGVDTTPPDAPINLVVGLAGAQLTGRGEAGTTVQVRDAAGNVIATGAVGPNGTFAVSLNPAVKDGSTLQVILTDAAGNVSQPGSVASPDLTAPAQPTDLALADGVTFTGRGEPGATVQVRDAAGTLIGTGIVGSDGLFSLTLSPAQANGQALDVQLVDAAGNVSAPLQFDAPDITPPDAVTNILIGPGGTALSGRGEAGATVEVRDVDGNLLGRGLVTANGTFLVSLDPAAQPGEQLSLVQIDPSGNASVAVDYEVPVTTAPESPTNLAISADGTALTGTAPAGSRVEARGADGTLIGSAVANADGTFSITLNPAQANGELLDVVAIENGLSSLPAQVTAPDITAPAAPTELAVSADGTVITGRAEPGSTVRILGANGTELGTAVVGATGLFSISLTPPQVDGEVLQATATDAAGNTSTASTVTAPDIDGVDTTPPGAPVDLVVGLAGTQLSGRGEAGTTVQVRDAAGNVIATGTVGPDGTFAVSLNPAVKDGSTLQVTLTDAAGNVSQPGSVASPDLTAPAQPTDLALADGVTFTGRGEPGATVQVRDAAGTVIGTGVVGSDGLFSLTLSPAQANGQALDVRLVDAAGNASAPLQFDAPDITPPDAVTNILVGPGGTALSGRGEAGATVEVRDADGNLLGRGVVTANGTFLVSLDPAAQPGEQLSLVQIDPSGNASVAVDYEVPVTTAPESPTNLAISADGTALTGTAPAGSSVEARGADGTLIGSAVANADGTFSIPLNPAQANGELLDVVALENGLSSLPAQVTAPDITAPAAPTELAVSADGTVITGRAEPGSTVRILGANGTELGTAVVGAMGLFSISLTPPQVDGEVLQATATDAAGNTSTAGTVTAPDIDGVDTTPPDAPINLVVGLAGTQLAGRGEAGTTVQVRDAAGNVIATGTVGPNGTFAVSLNPAVKDGGTLQVTLIDAAGNVSQPGTVASPDLTAPAQPTDLALADGATFTGRGEPGATVQVRDAVGTLIGTGVVGSDGLFNITLSPAQANGQALDVRLVDAAGNISAPLQFDAPDITSPDAVTNILVGPGGTALSGRGEAGAIVEVRDADGNLLGRGVVSANGTFLVNLDPAAQPGEQLSLVQIDPSGNASVAVDYEVPLTTEPESPTNLTVNADGTVLTGTAPAGARVEVRGTDGALIGSATANADGTFSIPLNPAQANGELLDVVAIQDGLSSLPAQVTAPDITAPAAPTELAVSVDGTVITGRAEPGSTVCILAANGTELGTAVVGATGLFSISLTPPQVDGEVLQATATDAAGNTSAAGTVTAPDIDGVDTTPPNAPIDLVIGLAGTQLTGRGEAGATVQIRDAAGNVIATGTVGSDGTFAVSLNPAVKDGSTLQVTLTDAAGNVSQPGSVASPDLTAPAQPTDLALADGVTFTGRGEPGATVQVRDAAGALIGTGVVGADGLFSLTLSPAQANGQALDVWLVDAAGNVSAPLQFDAPDITSPDAVTNILVGPGGTALSGRGEAGATVEVRDADGNLLGRGVVSANGTFLVSLDPAAQPGEQLSLVQIDPSGNASVAVDYEVPLTTAPESPTNLTVNADGTALTGTAPAGARVEVRDTDGTLIGSATANADGTFSIPLNPAQANGELLDVVAIEDGLSSLPAQITAPDITPPVIPSDLAINTVGTQVSGRGEPGSTIRVLAANGTTVLGSVVVGATGSFSVTLAPPQVNGEVLQVTATDGAGNVSGAGSITAPDIDGGDTTPPLAPTDLVIGLAGALLSGRGEAGATVQVRDTQGNLLVSGSVNADGTFQLSLDPAVRDGSSLLVVLTDAAGNVSPPATVVSPDLQAPAQPTDLALDAGATFTGRGEPGASVEVRTAAGVLVGTGSVTADGTFSLTLSPPQTNGEVLDVRLVDAAGNRSTPLQFDAPDITPPAPVSNIVVGNAGLTLSGRGEAGASIEVRDGNGALIGSGVVGVNGTFLLNLDTPALPGAQLTLVQTDPSGNASQALVFEVPTLPTPASPTGLVVAEDGSSISGTAPAGSGVQVRDADGTLVGSVVVGAEGTFTIPLQPAQANGQLLDVVAVDGNGTASLPVQITAPDITPPQEPGQLLVSADGSVVTGRAEAGSTVRVLAADGITVLGSAVVGATGAFSIGLTPAQVAGEQLQVTATDTAGNTSAPGLVTAPTIDTGIDTIPPQPATDLAISASGGTVSGRGEAGTTVQVRNDQGQLLASATVQADGSFVVQLQPPVVDGSALQVTLTDAAGNVSTPVSLSAPDQVPPAQPTDLVLNAGVTLTGTAEAGARVEVRDAAGNLIGNAIVQGSGTFSLTLTPPQANGEALSITVTDAAGNTSLPLAYTAPDITPPAAVTDVVTGAGSLAVAGQGEAGATVQVRNTNGDVLGTATVAANGTFVVNLGVALNAGEALVLVQTDAAGNTSIATNVTVPQVPIPASPSAIVVAADGSSVSGTAPANSQVEVRDAQGTLLGSAQAGANGDFTLGLQPPQANGETLEVVAIDDGGNRSLPVQVIAPDITAPSEPTDLQLSPDGSVLTGRGEAGTTVEVTDAQGTLLGTAQVGANGVISVQLTPPQTDGQVLEVVLRDAAGNSSSTTVTAPDLDGPLQPSALSIDTAGLHLTGVGQVGSIITVRAANGAVLGVTTVGADGRFDVTLAAAQRNGENLTVEATDSLGNSAGPVPFTAPDTTPPLAVTSAAINGEGSVVTGTGEPGATVSVRGPDGTVLGTAQVGANGAFEVALVPPQTNGQMLSIEQRDLAGNLSVAVDLMAPDNEPPAMPGELTLTADGVLLAGIGEPGARVTVTGSTGTTLGTAVVQADGSFSVTLSPPQLNGQTLSVTQADPAGNLSPAGTLIAPDLEPPLPADGLALNLAGTLLTGQGEAGTTVEVRSASGALLGSVLVDAQGNFEVPLTPPQTNGEVLSVVLSDSQGNVSPSATFIADDITPPATATGLAINPGGDALQGIGEPGATVEVRNANGDVLGSVQVPAGGNFTVPLSPAQLDGQLLNVVLVDAAGNPSQPGQINAPDITPPQLPTGVQVSEDGIEVSGSAPGAATVTVRDSTGLEITVPVTGDGSFSVPLPTPLLNGEPLTVVVTDQAGNATAPITVTAPDTTPPLPATNVTISPDGAVVGGGAEPGSTVVIRNPDGSERGSETVGADGTFVVPVVPPLAAGETVTVVVVDPAGNTSTDVPLAGPTGNELATPSGLAISADGFLLTGQGTVGSLITVTSAGATLGTATVGSDGIFRVFFLNAQLNAQTLHVTARASAGGQPSVPATVVAEDTTAPDAPTAIAIDRIGSTLTGQGEVGATVRVTDGQGNLLGTATVAANGLFTVNFVPAVVNAQNLVVTQADAAGNVSLAATLQAPDLQAPPAASNLSLNSAATVLSGQGEAGATVTVSNAAGVRLGTGTVLADGSFRVELSPAQIDNQVLSVQQADPPGNVSEPVSVVAPDLTPPAAATALQLSVAGDTLGGIGEAGATVRVFVGTSQIGTGQVTPAGIFTVQLDAAQLNGQVLQVTLTDAAGNVSPISSLTALDITPPAAVVATINDSGTQVVGTAEAGARVTVLNNAGDLVGQGVAAADGTFVLALVPAQVNGQSLSVIAQDATGNPSPALALDAPDLTPPVQPSNLVLDPLGATLTGTAEAGSTLSVRGPNGAEVGTVQVPEGGAFTVALNPLQNNGQLLTIVSTDAAGNESIPATLQARDTSPPAPVTDLAVDNTFTVITGRGEPGATVTISKNNQVIGTGEVSEAGTFQIVTQPAAGSVASLVIYQTDAASNTSASVTYITPVAPPPVPPTNVVLAGDGLTLTGNAPTGTGIRVYDAAGNQIGVGGATLNGAFSLQLNTPQLNGQQLTVTAVALVGGESQPTFVVAADITPPANPVVIALSPNGLVLTGSGEGGATVTVRDASSAVLGTAVVNTAGSFSVNLNAAQLNGQVLSVSQADRAGNVSASTSFTAVDVQPPAAPTNVAVNGTGTVLTGNGEAGATVTVQGPGGQVGSGLVQANGTFSITLTTPQNDGQLLVVRQADAAGNLSGSVSLAAPDITPPAAPVATINALGTAVSGSGQVGSTATVRNSAGTVLGTATVGSNGLFVVSLAAAQIDNQALTVTLTDGAGNVSTSTALTAPDLTPPAAAGNLQFSADGSSLTGTGEVGATVTVRSATGTVLQTGTVQANGTFTLTLNPPQDNGQIVSVTLSDPRGNLSGNVTVTAPDVDANAPVIASDNLATAVVNLAPVVSTRVYQDTFSTLLAGFSKTFTWTVAAGTTADPTLTLSTNSALALLDNATFTLQVKNASGNWVTLATGNSQGLLDLVLLPLGQGIRVGIGELLAGDYRLTVGSGGIGLLTTVTTALEVQTTSLTQFTGTGTAASGNVITDVGIDGSVDARGPDSEAVLQVLKAGSYISAGSATTVQGLYGTLVIRGDGSYTYTPNGSPASVGKVDVFSYQLVHPNGKSDTANLYVRIDSPQATETWNDNNYAAPATVVDAVNDVDNTNISLVNLQTSSSTTFAALSLPVLGSRSATYTTTVAANTSADLQVVLNSTNLLGLLNGTTLELLKLNPTTGQYVTVQTVAGTSLLSLLGGGAGYTFQNQGAGTYHVRVTAGGIGLLSSLTTTVNATATHLNEFVVGNYTPVSGNLLTDGAGADNLGSPLTVLSVLTAANTFTLPGYNGASVQGTYGTLVVFADGSYTYTLNAGLTSAVVGQKETFTYELTHPNGTTDTATLTINLDPVTGFTTSSALVADASDEGVALSTLASATAGEVAVDSDDGSNTAVASHVDTGTQVTLDNGFVSVDTGTGNDALLWGGGDASIDLANLAGQVHDLEVIDLNATSAVALTLSLADVVAVTDSANDTLIIKGDEHDTVLMTDTWNRIGNHSLDGIDYNQYTAQEDPSHQLWVQNGIHVV